MTSRDYAVRVAVRLPDGQVYSGPLNDTHAELFQRVKACRQVGPDYERGFLTKAGRFEPAAAPRTPTAESVKAQQVAHQLLSEPDSDQRPRAQEVIASIDELIALQTRKLELLKQHKQGLVQKLLPRKL